MTTVNAQPGPGDFLGRLPKPGDVCSVDTVPRNQFHSMVSAVSVELNNDIRRRKNEAETSVKNNEEQMRANALKQTGVSPDIAQKMMALQQRKKTATSQAEKEQIDKEMKALTGQMVQQSTNISMGEISNMKNMSKEGKEAWASGYATEKKAEVMAEPEKYKDQNVKAMEKHRLLSQYTRLNDSLGAAHAKYITQFQDLENDQEGKRILEHLEYLNTQLSEELAKGLSGKERSEEIRASIYSEQVSYCRMQSPRYLQILGSYEVFMRNAIPDYYRLEELSNQVNEAQTGVRLDIEPGLLALEALADYVSRLNAAYKYNIIGEDPSDENLTRKAGIGKY